MTWIMLEKDGGDGPDPLKIWTVANWDGIDSEVKEKELKEFESKGENWSPKPVNSRSIFRTIHAPITVTDSAISGGMGWPPWLMRDVIRSFKYTVKNESCTNEGTDVVASGILDQVLLKIGKDPEHFAARGDDVRLFTEKDDLQCLVDEIVDLQKLVEKGCKCGKKCVAGKYECVRAKRRCGSTCPKGRACSNGYGRPLCQGLYADQWTKFGYSGLYRDPAPILTLNSLINNNDVTIHSGDSTVECELEPATTNRTRRKRNASYDLGTRTSRPRRTSLGASFTTGRSTNHPFSSPPSRSNSPRLQHASLFGLLEHANEANGLNKNLVQKRSRQNVAHFDIFAVDKATPTEGMFLEQKADKFITAVLPGWLLADEPKENQGGSPGVLTPGGILNHNGLSNLTPFTSINLSYADEYYRDDLRSKYFDNTMAADAQLIKVIDESWNEEEDHEDTYTHFLYQANLRLVMQVKDYVDDDDDEVTIVSRDSQEAIEIMDKFMFLAKKESLSDIKVRIAELKCRMFLNEFSVKQNETLAQILGARRSFELKNLQMIRKTWDEFESLFARNTDDANLGTLQLTLLIEWNIKRELWDSFHEGSPEAIQAEALATQFKSFYSYALCMLVFADVVYLVAMGDLRTLSNVDHRDSRLQFWEEKLSDRTIRTFSKLMQHCLVRECVIEAGDVQSYIRKYLSRLSDDIFRFQIVGKEIEPYWPLYDQYFEEMMCGRFVCTSIDVPVNKLELVGCMRETGEETRSYQFIAIQESTKTLFKFMAEIDLHDALAFEVVEGVVTNQKIRNHPAIDDVEACKIYDHILANVFKSTMQAMASPHVGLDDEAG
ncbi:uncharacterized protein EAE98_012463 [Botrytis deweyae]|uniref:Zn(2)-C6 fungal-type domain-containing protein n=1 Tax=Botrytis deweyae TaxID=2478750 RepID=A0ABQ7I2Y4_9HELO|nr:uncharacterized protein EAE98_012463 [Botrytis deweyae]KAF7907968.1 hypothetical protein EAE98_012463 [Botrytis deweyae]